MGPLAGVLLHGPGPHVSNYPVTKLPNYPFFSTFAQVSRSPTVRLKTGLPGKESGSAQK